MKKTKKQVVGAISVVAISTTIISSAAIATTTKQDKKLSLNSQLHQDLGPEQPANPNPTPNNPANPNPPKENKKIEDSQIPTYTKQVDDTKEKELKKIVENSLKNFKEQIDKTLENELLDNNQKYNTIFYLHELQKYFNEKAKGDEAYKDPSKFGFHVIAPYLIAKFKKLKTGKITYNGESYDNVPWSDKEKFNYEPFAEKKEQTGEYENDYGDQERFSKFVNAYFESLSKEITNIINHEDDQPKLDVDYKITPKVDEKTNRFYLENSGPSDSNYKDWQDWIQKKIEKRFLAFDLKQAQKIIEQENQEEPQQDPLEIIPGETDISDPNGQTSKVPESFNTKELRNQKPWLRAEYVNKSNQEIIDAFNNEATKKDVFFFKNGAQSRISLEVTEVKEQGGNLVAKVQLVDKIKSKASDIPRTEIYETSIFQIPEQYKDKRAYSLLTYQSTQSLNNVFDRLSRDGLGINLDSYDITQTTGLVNQVRLAMRNISTGVIKLMFSKSFTQAQDTFIRNAYKAFVNNSISQNRATNSVTNNSNILLIEYIRASKVNRLPILQYLTVTLNLKASHLRSKFIKPPEPKKGENNRNQGQGQNPAPNQPQAQGGNSAAPKATTEQNSFSTLHQDQTVPSPESTQAAAPKVDSNQQVQLDVNNVTLAFNKANISLIKLTKLFDRLTIIKNTMQEDSAKRSINPITWFDAILNKSTEHSNIFLALFSAHQDIANSSPNTNQPAAPNNGGLVTNQQDQTTELSPETQPTNNQQPSEVALSKQTISLLLNEIEKIDRPSKTAVGVFAAIGSLGIILLIALLVTFTKTVSRNRRNKEKI
ncbi:MSC_0620 family F1-like ATPase-associated subunit [Ureaplasma diversum]|uniref:Uncharacterized protein n=1 Tax=Ureaplasma diversum NCTC 246 TaxID=1188241 RepID=A0A084EZW6_9BACT|nr:hypothetical protein [Ureaplasma diversum]KEZ23508.1 Hypothetical protein, predicted transmembrane protein [Ureaplasma diversum NCTC 246]